MEATSPSGNLTPQMKNMFTEDMTEPSPAEQTTRMQVEPPEVIEGSQDRVLVKAKAKAHQEEQKTSVSAQKGTELPFYASLGAYIPKVIQDNNNSEPAVDFNRSLLKAPPKQLKVNAVPQTALELKAFWEEHTATMQSGNEKFIGLATGLMGFISAVGRNVESLFQSFVLRIGNPDLKHYIEYLKEGAIGSFAISTIENAAYSSIPDKKVKASFALCRFIKVKRDLVECLLATFDTLCFHRHIMTGFEICDPQPDGLLLTPKYKWFGNYTKAEDKEDQVFTKNAITPEGISEMIKATVVESKTILEEHDGGSVSVDKISTDIHVFLKEDFILELEGTKEKCKQTNCFPLYKLLLGTDDSTLPPMYRLASEQKGCHIIKGCQNILSGGDGRKILKGPAQVGKSLKKTLSKEVAVFCTKVEISLKHIKVDMPRTDMLLDNSLHSFPFRQEIVYGLLNRESKQTKLLSSAAPQDCARDSIVPNVYEPALNLGWLVQSDPQVSAKLIDDFFSQDFFLNIEPSLVIHNLHTQDRYTVNMNWHGIEGEPCFVTCYLIASYLRGCIQLSYEKEVDHLMGKASNEHNLYAQNIIKQCFPNVLKQMEQINTIRNNF